MNTNIYKVCFIKFDMVLMAEDNRKFNVKLNVDEMNLIIDSLENTNYSLALWYGEMFIDLLNKLKMELNKNENR